MVTSKSLSGNNIASPWQPLFGRQFLHFFFQKCELSSFSGKLQFSWSNFYIFQSFLCRFIGPGGFGRNREIQDGWCLRTWSKTSHDIISSCNNFWTYYQPCKFHFHSFNILWRGNLEDWKSPIWIGLRNSDSTFNTLQYCQVWETFS